jgi:hypothetical protein
MAIYARDVTSAFLTVKKAKSKANRRFGLRGLKADSPGIASSCLYSAKQSGALFSPNIISGQNRRSALRNLVIRKVFLSMLFLPAFAGVA